MPTRKLTADEREEANPLLQVIRRDLDALSAGDDGLRFAYNRKISKELQYDERGTPTERRMLKAQKFGEQQGGCSACGNALGPGGRIAELHTVEAMNGYTAVNTR